MKQRPRIYYTEEQKALLWDRWQSGINQYHSPLTTNGSQSKINEPTLVTTPGFSRPMPQSRAQLIKGCARKLECSEAHAQFIFVWSPVRENSASQIPYAHARVPEHPMITKRDGPHTKLDFSRLNYFPIQ